MSAPPSGFDAADAAARDAKARFAVTAALCAALAVLALAGLAIGYVRLPVAQVLGALVAPSDDVTATIVRAIRLPRVLLGIFIGASLGASGAALQGLLRNPLAEPGIIGVSASGGLGAVIALYFGFAAASPLALPGSAMAGALVSMLVLYAVASRDAGTLTLILAGVAISSFAVALTSLAMNLAPNPYAVSEMVTWLLGSIKDRSFADFALAAPFMAAGWLFLLAVRRPLDALALGEDAARSLGVSLPSAAFLVIAGTTLSVGAAVAVSGAIGFVGLVVPHLLRPLLGHQPGALVLPSALGGAVLVTAADIFVRLAPTTNELTLGVVTALIGAPFFLYLVIATRRSLP
ncbi:MAG: iron ABC transporter permease [Alphaproteobacteria bacterium]